MTEVVYQKTENLKEDQIVLLGKYRKENVRLTIFLANVILTINVIYDYPHM